ncbi:MAG TPA: [FeFe] hydrogenase H-cluster radical SAM maturase HydG [bacterium]|nr:[FeFe] hydrogenase H-cluster radical SAM maturase HydG [bacterium]HOL47554.1 [FeFe] hydrogenase H-cluster radical SAM maturase HydG [bacterium]HPQ18447.1 [FeFe] hydrogenase H-cluster radical SAM maturase HydG [bacterium]
MLYINEEKIFDLLNRKKNANESEIHSILEKAKNLQRLSLEETAVLLNVNNTEILEKIYQTANYVKNKIYGKRVVLFAPLYISNYCKNNCLYCGFKAENKLIKRKALTKLEIQQETEILLKQGHKRILMVCGEDAPNGLNSIDYYVEAIKTIYEAEVNKNKIKRVNINCAPLSVDEFKKLKKASIGTYQLFQETYHQETYKKMHLAGKKSDPDNRIDAIDRAFLAGIDDVGLGVLFGLYDYKFEVLGLLSHIEHLEQRFNVGPHTISVPRIEPAEGAEISFNPPYKLSDDDFKKVVAILRLAVPYTGIILSTRESPQMRDLLLHLGVSQISAGSKTSPGGYSKDSFTAQFSIGDYRSLNEIVSTLIKYNYIPSFCAACYRKKRTGEIFMSLAKPGTIKDKCTINALITLKEFLLDFAESELIIEANKLIDFYSQKLTKPEQDLLNKIFLRLEQGYRDEYI